MKKTGRSKRARKSKEPNVVREASLNRGTGVNREYKDRLFKRVFREKKDLLDLYNAVNGTSYDNPDELEINTLDDAIYMGMKNDISFVVDDILNLYEHQTSFNPNMPLRGLFYITNIFKGIIGADADIYSSRILPLPLPKYIVFYNGTKQQPERSELSIRDAFASEKREESCLEFKAIMLNINLGYNKKLMEKCRRLREYAELISLIRKYIADGNEIREAVDLAVEECIRNGVLKDILSKNKTEVQEMILTEYNEQRHIENEKNISLEEGRKLGWNEGRKSGWSEGATIGEQRFAGLAKKLIEAGKTEELLRAAEDEEYRRKLFAEFKI